MNKTERMLAIVLELQRKGVRRAEDLAAAFETSKRTIYRDMQALSETGVPIVGSPGAGYSLMEGYFLPPVSLSAQEAVCLLIGADFVGQAFDREYGVHARGAAGKIEAVLPAKVGEEAGRVRETIRLLTDSDGRMSEREKAAMAVLREAILERRKVRFAYVKQLPDRDGNRHSSRVAAPYGVALVYGTWMLVAHCEMRKEIRHFRLSRMRELTVLEESFAFPEHFRLQDYRPADDRELRVRVRIDPEIADRVAESPPFFLESIEEFEDAQVASLRARRIGELLPWLLGWGADVEVLEPESVRERMREEIRKMANRY